MKKVGAFLTCVVGLVACGGDSTPRIVSMNLEPLPGERLLNTEDLPTVVVNGKGVGLSSTNQFGGSDKRFDYGEEWRPVGGTPRFLYAPKWTIAGTAKVDFWIDSIGSQQRPRVLLKVDVDNVDVVAEMAVGTGGYGLMVEERGGGYTLSSDQPGSLGVRLRLSDSSTPQ